MGGLPQEELACSLVPLAGGPGQLGEHRATALVRLEATGP
jgi:hypothetical protein